MSKTMTLCSLSVCATFLAFVTRAAAASFTFIVLIGGGQIGAVSGSTLYGTTGAAGGGGYGRVFSITPSWTFAAVYSFANQGDGAHPSGNLVRDSSGAIYHRTAYRPMFKIVPRPC
jgi:hypothetical protein